MRVAVKPQEPSGILQGSALVLVLFGPLINDVGDRRESVLIKCPGDTVLGGAFRGEK